MKTDEPFLKSFACGVVLFLVLVVWTFAKGGDNIAYRIGYTLTTCLFPATTTGIWGWFSRKHWSWGRFIVTFLLMCIVTAVLLSSGRAHRLER